MFISLLSGWGFPALLPSQLPSAQRRAPVLHRPASYAPAVRLVVGMEFFNLHHRQAKLGSLKPQFIFGRRCEAPRGSASPFWENLQGRTFVGLRFGWVGWPPFPCGGNRFGYVGIRFGWASVSGGHPFRVGIRFGWHPFRVGAAAASTRKTLGRPACGSLRVGASSATPMRP
jgi:hypothetical protein